MSLSTTFALFIFTFYHLVAPRTALATAAADPKTETITITASVPDNVPPTTPILISPENNSYVTSDYVTFIWQSSTDSNGIKEYELSLDGAIYLTGLPTHDAETTQFTLDYDPTTNRYTLKDKRPLPNGTHSWKIRAKDTLDNGTDSATWSFTLDTQAPNFILSQVGAVPTSISAQDVSTVPTQPIELNENKPQLLGHGEANSTVVLTITIPGDPSQTWTQTTDINGNWGQKLSILPRNIVMRLDFTITDQAGLISVLNNIPFIINTRVITLPLTTSTPPPSPTSSPTSGVTPPATIATSPLSSPRPPLIAIPLTPPIEIAHEILQEIEERLPAPIAALLNHLPADTKAQLTATATSLFPFLSLLILVLISLLALIAMMGRFGKSLSPRLIWRTVQALGIFPQGKPQGLVYDSQTHQGIPFALIEVRDENDQTIDQVVTDKNGLYRGLILQPGQYRLLVSHPNYQFPTALTRPTNLTAREFYLSDFFTVTTKYPATEQRLYLIPVDETSLAQKNRSLATTPLSSFSSTGKALFIPLFIITSIIALIFPSFWNWLILGGYCWSAINQAKTRLVAPHLTGHIIDDSGQVLMKAIVAVIDQEKQQFIALIQTDQSGFFSTRLSQSQLQSPPQLEIIKPGFMWVENNTPVTDYSLENALAPTHLVLTLKHMTSTENKVS